MSRIIDVIDRFIGQVCELVHRLISNFRNERSSQPIATMEQASFLLSKEGEERWWQGPNLAVALLYKDEMEEAKKNLRADTTPLKGPRHVKSSDGSKGTSNSNMRVWKAVQDVKELKQKTRYGILR